MTAPMQGRRIDPSSQANGRPVTIGVPPTEALQPETSAASRAAATALRWPLLAGLALFAVLWLEAAVAETALITPINRTFLNNMRAIGLIVGLLLSLVVVGANSGTGFRKALTLIVLPVMIAFVFDGIAWRIADWRAFGLSSQPFAEARYPVLRAHFGRKGARDTLEIDPFGTGEAADIPIPAAQYEEVYRDASDYCVTVLQRRSPSGAIEIRTNGAFTWQPPVSAVLARCERHANP